jgi:hypothetical protein
MKLLFFGIIFILLIIYFGRSVEQFTSIQDIDIDIDFDTDIDFDKLNDTTKKDITKLANEYKIPINSARLLYNARKIDNSIIKKKKGNNDICPWPSDLEEDQKKAQIVAQSKLNSFKEKNNILADDLQKIKILKDEKMRRKLKESEKNARTAIEKKIVRLKKYDHNHKSDIYTKCPIAEFPYNSFDDSQYLLDVTRHSDSKWNGLDDKVALVNKLPFNFVTH